MKKFVIIIFFVSSCIYAQSQVKNAVDSLFRKYYAGDTIVGVSIGVVFRNPNTNEYLRKLFFYGEKNRATHEAPDSLTVYQIGSVTKTFTAMVMAQMLRNNTIHRNDLIQSYLPDSVRIPYWVVGSDTTRINILELVTHFSGLIDEPPGISYPYTIGNMYNYLDTCHLMWKPDSAWNYSNLGFASLATGLTYKAGRDSIEQLFQQWIADSLGMPDTKITRTLSMIQRSAKGYIKTGPNSWSLADSNKSTWPAFNGAGAIRSTIKDMTRYLEFQMKLLNSTLNPLADTMHKHIKRINPGGSTQKWQGMAWASNHLYFHPQNPWVTFKDGGTPGYNSYIAFYTDSATGIKGGAVILSNSGSTAHFENSQKVDSLTMDILLYLNKVYSVIGIQQIGTGIPNGYSLMQNFPNPFNPSTKINFNIPVSGNVKIKIYDSIGRLVKILVNSQVNAGSYTVDFYGENLTSGVYFYEMESGSFKEIKKMVFIK